MSEATAAHDTSSNDEQQQQQQQPTATPGADTHAEVVETETETETEAPVTGGEALQELTARLSSEDVQLRLNTAKRLPVLLPHPPQRRGQAQRGTGTLQQLFCALAHDDNDEVVLALAEALEALARAWMAAGDDARALLPVLEGFCTHPDSAVSSRAIKALAAIAECCCAPAEAGSGVVAAMREALCNTIASLAASKWITARAAAAALVPALLDIAAQPQEVWKLLIALGSDNNATTRRAAVAAMPAALGKAAAPDAAAAAALASLLASASKAEADGVRAQVPAALAALLAQPQLPGADKEQLLATAARAANDSCWRVRVAVAEQLPQLCRALGDPAAVQQHVLPLCLGLLHYLAVDPEVSVAAAGHLRAVAAALPRPALTSLVLPALADLVRSPVVPVRAAAASAACDVAPLFDRAAGAALAERVVEPLLLDPDAEVALALLKRADTLVQVLGTAAVGPALVGAAENLARSEQWRVRTEVAHLVPLLADALGGAPKAAEATEAARDDEDKEEGYLADQLGVVCAYWLGDDVCAVRDAAAECLGKLAARFGTGWACAAALPTALQFASHPRYLCRLACLAALAELGPLLPQDAVDTRVLDAVLAMTQDPVANVRFNAATALQALAPHTARTASIAARLGDMLHDRDVDVRQHAKAALSAIEQQQQQPQKEQDDGGKHEQKQHERQDQPQKEETQGQEQPQKEERHEHQESRD